MLLTHIDKEDNVLYPMADARLSEDRDRELTKDFGASNRLTGAGAGIIF